jgi:hypothetical protein
MSTEKNPGYENSKRTKIYYANAALRIEAANKRGAFAAKR